MQLVVHLKSWILLKTKALTFHDLSTTRQQLSVYLRLLDIAPLGMYGPSARTKSNSADRLGLRIVARDFHAVTRLEEHLRRLGERPAPTGTIWITICVTRAE